MRKLFSENIEVHEHESWSKFKSGEKIVRDDLGLEDVAILDELKNWSREKGAISIDIITNNVRGHAIYGFEKKATMMTIEL